MSKSIASKGDKNYNRQELRLSQRKKCPYSEFFWSEWGKIRTRKALNIDTFHAVYN